MKKKVIVIGAGHAGLEAAFVLSKLKEEVILFTTDIGALALMPCNPNIGGTAKGHLVRELDALGGEMGLSADKALLQLKMLNASKGPAVHSLRGQIDKASYHLNMLEKVRSDGNIELIEKEVTAIAYDGKRTTGVYCDGSYYEGDAVIIASGVYLDSRIITGEVIKKEGPSGYKGAGRGLGESLRSLGVDMRRFKTGTPARVLRSSLDFDKMQIEHGEDNIHTFSFLNDDYCEEKEPCYLTYTNEATHRIILDNIDKAPLFNGVIEGIGPRYCPSIEDKIMRFKDKARHQVFIEPEGENSSEMYVQGMSTSMPDSVQEEMLHSIEGLEHCVVTKYGYAIEYECINPLELTASLAVRRVSGLFSAGQFNGTSGYEEAAAQGLLAGINAHLYLWGKPPFVLARDEAYIGVLIDDLVTKGTNEPYRMMTARAEHRLKLRQDNADLRLTPYAIGFSIADEERIRRLERKKAHIEVLLELSEKVIPPRLANPILQGKNQPTVVTGISVKELVRRGIGFMDLRSLDGLESLGDIDPRAVETTEIELRYKGYIDKQEGLLSEMQRLENTLLPDDIDYSKVTGLRIEARQKLQKQRPISLGQASRISGINPSDVTVLIVELAKRRRND